MEGEQASGKAGNGRCTRSSLRQGGRSGMMCWWRRWPSRQTEIIK